MNKYTMQDIRNMDKGLVYDIGMNDGQDALNYMEKGFRVLAVEANPKLCEQANKKFAVAIKRGFLKVVNIGITDSFGKKTFYARKMHRLSSFDIKAKERSNYDYESMEVQTSPFEEILNKYGMPFFIKVDIEEYDFHCLTPLRKDYKPKYISFELSKDRGILDLEKMKEIGFTKFKLVNQRKITPFGTSGDFGDNAIDITTGMKWRTYDEIIDSVKKVLKEYETIGNVWYDIHVTDDQDIFPTITKVHIDIKFMILKSRIMVYPDIRYIIDKNIGKIGILIKKASPRLYETLKAKRKK